jgi:hypothetical protein
LWRSVKKDRTSSFATPTAAEQLHHGRDISPILLRQIAKDIGLTVDELLKQQ